MPIVTQTLVDAADPAFNTPTKFVGPVYGAKEAEALAKQLDWTVKQDGEYYRRVVPSPRPHEILQLGAVRALLESPANVPSSRGGGGAPVSRVFGDIVGVGGDRQGHDGPLWGARSARTAHGPDRRRRHLGELASRTRVR